MGSGGMGTKSLPRWSNSGRDHNQVFCWDRIHRTSIAFQIFFLKGLETWPFPFYPPQPPMLQVFYSLLPKEMEHYMPEHYSICPSALPLHPRIDFTEEEKQKNVKYMKKFEAGAAGRSERDALG